MTSIVSDYLELFLAFSAVIGVVYGLIRRGQKALEAKILKEISEATAQIRKDANGGQSLNDANRAIRRIGEQVDCLVDNQKDIKTDISMLKASVVILENDKEGIDG